MKAIFYYNTSEAIKVDKNLEYIAELEIVFKTSVSIKNPIIDLELKFQDNKTLIEVVDEDNQDVVVGINNDLLVSDYPFSITDFNYCYIPVLERYYYVNNPILVTDRLFRLELSEDVLMSLKAQFRELDAFVTRNEYTFNALVKDDLISYYYDKEIDERTMVSGSKVNTIFKTDMNLFENNAIITAINMDVDSFNTDKAVTPSAYLPTIYNNVTGSTFTSMSYSTDSISVNHLMKCIIDDNDLASFVISVTLYPFTFPKESETMHYIKLGDTYLNDTGNQKDVPVYYLKSNVPQYLVIADFTYNGNGDFMDYEPYKQYELFIPYLSYISISADELLGNRILVYYVPNYTTGKSQVVVFNQTKNRIIYTSTCQLGNRLSISTTNAKEVNDSNINNGINLGIGLLSASLGVATGNPFAVATGVLSAGKSISSFIQNVNTNYLKASGSASDGVSGLYMYQLVRLRITSYKPKDYNSDYFKLYGRPLNKVVKLNTLSGFTQIDDIHLENIKAFENEKIELYDLLKSGIIL